MKNSNWWWFLGAAFFLAACNGDKEAATQETTATIPQQQQTQQPARQVTVPDFNADSAYAFVAKQVGFGPRVPNTQVHRITGDYLVSKFKEYGAQVQEQRFQMKAYDGTNLNLRNIIATYKIGRASCRERVSKFV